MALGHPFGAIFSRLEAYLLNEQLPQKLGSNRLRLVTAAPKNLTVISYSPRRLG